MVSVKDIVNAPSTMAPVTGSVMNVVKSQHQKGNFMRARGASLLMIPAHLLNAPAHIVLGAVKAVVATGMKVVEIAAAAVGFKDVNLNRSAWTSNYTGQQAAHHLGKGVLGTLIMLTADVLSVLSPSILIKAADTFGFASSNKKPLDQAKDTANSIFGWCKKNIFTPAKNVAVKVGHGVVDHKKKIGAAAAVVAGAAAWYTGMLEGTQAKIASYIPDVIKNAPCDYLPDWPGIKQARDWYCSAE